MTKRRSHTFPNAIMTKLEDEAKRRLDQRNQKYTRLLGSEVRDIICLCVKVGLNAVKRLSLEEYKDAVKDVCKEVR